jgi:hypothetical protein
MGFTATGSDSSLFVYNHGAQAAYLLVYVDDIILTASTPSLLHDVINKLCQAFAIKDLGALHGVQVRRDDDGFLLNQS